MYMKIVYDGTNWGTHAIYTRPLPPLAVSMPVTSPLTGQTVCDHLLLSVAEYDNHVFDSEFAGEYTYVGDNIHGAPIFTHIDEDSYQVWFHTNPVDGEKIVNLITIGWLMTSSPTKRV